MVHVFQSLNESRLVLPSAPVVLLCTHTAFQSILYCKTSHVCQLLDQHKYNHEILVDYQQNKHHDLVKKERIEFSLSKIYLKFLPYIPSAKYRSSKPLSMIPCIASSDVP